MPITLESSAFDAITEFYLAAGRHLECAEQMTARLICAIEQSGETVESSQTVFLTVALARARALREIGVAHPALISNFHKHSEEHQQFLRVTNQAIFLLCSSFEQGKKVPDVVDEIESLRCAISEIIYGDGNT